MSHCCAPKARPDYLYRTTASLLAILLLLSLTPWTAQFPAWLAALASGTAEILGVVWWGIALGMVMIGLLSLLPRELVLSLFGKQQGIAGIVRAATAGVLLDLCSHGILMVAAKLYERGVSTAQVMAFLIASPWNSFSFTLMLIALIGLPWTLLFVVLSMLVAVTTGLMFQWLETTGRIKANPNRPDITADFDSKAALIKLWQGRSFSLQGFLKLVKSTYKESRMILRWIFLGLLITVAIRTGLSLELYTSYFGPTVAGLGLTLLIATVLEICSEGSVPIAADLVTRAAAPGNSFTFLMAGVSTDYTEMLVLRQTTGSWKISLLLPLLTVPQVLVLGWLLNSF